MYIQTSVCTYIRMYVVVHEMNTVFFMISSFDGHHSGIGNIEPRVIFEGLRNAHMYCTYVHERTAPPVLH